MMKKLLVLLALFIGLYPVSPQEKFSVDILLDPKMAFMKDDHGNEPFTLNALINASVQLKQGDDGYFSIGQALEYVNLAGGKYLRYSIL